MKKGLVFLLSIISDGKFHSGQELAKQLCVSRAAIWKSIKQLELSGISIEAVRGKGYRLTSQLELLSEETIGNEVSLLVKKYCSELEVLFSTPSTNSYLLDRLITEQLHGNVVLAESQSRGRGRRGNSWFSPFGRGLYLSIAWHFNITPVVLGLLSLYIGVAIVRTLKMLGVNDVDLKWPNDILIKNRKLGGVLIDMRGEARGPVDVIVGVGINYSTPKAAAAGIEQAITDICSHSIQRISRNQIAASLLSHIFQILEKIDADETTGLIEEWRRYDCFTGKPAKLISHQNTVAGIVEGVDDQGSLLLNVGGEIQRYTSGELSLRLR